MGRVGAPAAAPLWRLLLACLMAEVPGSLALSSASSDAGHLRSSLDTNLIVRRKAASRRGVGAGRAARTLAANASATPRSVGMLSVHASSRYQDAECPLNTGGTCFLFSCAESEGPTECVNGLCICQEGYCATGGKCVRVGSGNHAFTKVLAPIRSVQDPSLCFDVSGGTQDLLLSKCEGGRQTKKFEMPVSNVGVLRWAADQSKCLKVCEQGESVQLASCVYDSPESQFVLAPGGEGEIRFMQNPRRCLSVVGEVPRLGSLLKLQECKAKVLYEQFYFGLEAPQLHLPCYTPVQCAKMNAQRVGQYCRANPAAPMCMLMKQCPPGGCFNGKCVSGYCVCNAGFQGIKCNQLAGIPVPIGSGPAFRNQGVTFEFSPGPTPGPGPAPGPFAPGPGPMGLAAGPAPAPALAPAPMPMFVPAPNQMVPSPAPAPVLPPAPAAPAAAAAPAAVAAVTATAVATTPGNCEQDTGGTCWLLGCDASRNAVCSWGKCLCQAGYCAVAGKCVAQSR